MSGHSMASEVNDGVYLRIDGRLVIRRVVGKTDDGRSVAEISLGRYRVEDQPGDFVNAGRYFIKRPWLFGSSQFEFVPISDPVTMAEHERWET